MNNQHRIDPEWAWATYRPSAAKPWTLKLAAHLYRRAAFGANWGQLQQALETGPQPAVDALLTPPADIEPFNATYDEYDQSVGHAESADQLRAWWLRRMLLTPFPLLEKMTLFWHSHFAVSNKPVKNAFFMQQYVQGLRSHALGSFTSLLEGICHDPAVLIGTECVENRKSRPNTAFARILVDHFTLGPEIATEQDVQQVATALTGSFVRRGRFQFIAREHDSGLKQILGQQGLFKGDDVIRILLEQPATAQHIVNKLYAWLISEACPPEASLVEPLVSSFSKDYNVGKLIETMLRSNLFFSESCYRQRIKSPVEYTLGIVQGLEGMISTTQLANALAELGQNLYHPPTVKGWQGGRVWINEAALIQRSNLAHALLQAKGPFQGKLNVQSILKKYGHTTDESTTRFLMNLFLQGDIGLDSAGSSEKTLYRAVTCPEFHLA
jgi:uncharacterized protein (DUF1800 family)